MLIETTCSLFGLIFGVDYYVPVTFVSKLYGERVLTNIPITHGEILTRYQLLNQECLLKKKSFVTFVGTVSHTFDQEEN